ncbi:SCAN domain-containing protein 3-like [Leptopilina heterotoma]|uniref:SCAN domain-containing protein 3-like n=1 Tax=Leptopilina heterotoma TaxID=63436 RepID=UPI001CA9FBF4|nr:SCAN domain-containing protein 3-like [Leptopilina heterotoma]
MVHGKPRHSQSQGSVERSNQDVRDMLVTWMADNNTKNWSEGLRFVQSKKNRVLHIGIKTSPYEAMFGCPQKIGLSDSPLLEEVYSSIKTEEELEQLLNTKNTEGVGDENAIAENAYIDEEVSLLTNKCHICGLEIDDTSISDKMTDEGKLICNVCCRKKKIINTRGAAAKGLQQQAEKMLAKSNETLAPVPVPRGRVAARSVLAVVEDITSDGLHRLGTKNGTLERRYVRNEFTPADSNFITVEDVPATTLSLRKASALNSGSTQGNKSAEVKKSANIPQILTRLLSADSILKVCGHSVVILVV